MDYDRDTAFDTPPSEVTADLFVALRAARRGGANPERMNNPVWDWLARSRISPYDANRAFETETPLYYADPGLCFDRFGQSETALADGRVVLIGGEHEDFYDPDFFIYNDVVVRGPDGTLDIYGYPAEVFAPTDFHSATLAGNSIVVIGSLGYRDERKPGFTPVHALDLESFAIEARTCTGASPGWLHKHSASYLAGEHALLVTGGLQLSEIGEPKFNESIDDWKLHLADWRWERLTERKWWRWELQRSDGTPSAMGTAQDVRRRLRDLAAEPPADSHVEHALGRHLQAWQEELGFAPDLALLETLYAPPVAHDVLPQNEDEDNVHRIRVDGVIVRYIETKGRIQVIVEGELAHALAESVVNDVRDKISALEQRPYDLIAQ